MHWKRAEPSTFWYFKSSLITHRHTRTQNLLFCMSLSGCPIVWEVQVPSISPLIFQIVLRWMRKGTEVFIDHSWISTLQEVWSEHMVHKVGLFVGLFLCGVGRWVCCESQLKKRSLCSQGGPSETSEMDERIALAKSYTGRSVYTYIYLV